MKRGKEVQTRGVVRMMGQNHQRVDVGRVGGRVVVEVVRSWLRRQHVKWSIMKWVGLSCLMLCGWTQASPLAMERRQAEAVWVQDGVGGDGCRQVQVTVVITQNQTVPRPDYPDGWVRSAWVTLLEQDRCTQSQMVNAAGQLDVRSGGGLEVDRKLGNATFAGTVLSWDGVRQAEGVISVSVDWVGVGPLSRQAGRTISRRARAAITLSGFGITLRQTVEDAQISISKY